MGGNLIAFDLGESQAKLVWFAGKTIKKAVWAPLPDNLVSNGEIVSMDAMGDFLRETAKSNGIPKGAAALILPASLVFTKTVEVPPMTDGQLMYNLPFEFKDYLSREKNEYYFDYAVQEQVKDEEGNLKQMRLFACATLKKTIEDYRDMFRRAGFRLKSAVPEEAAYAALLENREKDEDICFADIGYNAIRMDIYRDGNFVTKRTANLGLRDIVQVLAEQRGVDSHMAYEHMRTDYEDALTSPAVTDIYHNMAVEIMKAVNFYNYNNREQTLRRIYLCGGGAAIDTLRDSIAEMTGMELHSGAEFLPQGTDIPEQWLYVKAVGCGIQA